MIYTLAGFSAAAVAWSLPIAIAVTALLILLTASYRQTVDAYPTGGAAYSVARENLGMMPALVAGAALLIEYTLTVSVSVSAGVQNLGSAFPALGDYRYLIGLVVIFGMMVINLRGVRATSPLLLAPFYLFVCMVAITLAFGFWRLFTGAGAGAQVLGTGVELKDALPTLLFLRAFGSGCVALTGIESVTSGVNCLKEPAQRNTKSALVLTAILLGLLFLGVTALSHAFGLLPDGRETLLSMLGRTVYQDGPGHVLLLVATALVLFSAANSSYAAFPRLASLLAYDRFLPRQLMSVGDRLVYSNGVVGLSFAATMVMILFDWDTLRLLPLYASAVFLSLTLSQAGMFLRQLRTRKNGWRFSAALNGLGALTTAVVFLDILVTKIHQGLFLLVFAVPAFVFVFLKIKRHYVSLAEELSEMDRSRPAQFRKVKHTVVVPVSGIHQGVFEALQYAMSISSDVRACYVDLGAESTKRMEENWNAWAPAIPFTVLKSPNRSVIRPLLKFIEDVEQINQDELVTVVIPEFVTRKVWHQLLHNHTAVFIRAALSTKRRKVVTSVRYHLKKA